MFQWFAVLDFVLILSRIQISQMSWSRFTEDSKNNKNGDILNDLVKQLWRFLHTQFNFSWELFHFELGLLTFLKMAVLWRDFLYNLNLKNLGIICCAQQTMRKGGLHWVLSFFFSRGRYCVTISDKMRCAMDWGDLKRAYIKNERVKLNFDDDIIVMKVQKWRTQDEIN